MIKEIVFILSAFLIIRSGCEPEPGMSSHFQMFKRSLSNSDSKSSDGSKIISLPPKEEDNEILEEPLISKVGGSIKNEEKMTSTTPPPPPKALPSIIDSNPFKFQPLTPLISDLLTKGIIIKDILKLKWDRIVSVGTAILGLALALLVKMALGWIGPFLSSPAARATQSIIAQEASRVILANTVQTAINGLTNVFG